jgi:hypothetical protein
MYEYNRKKEMKEAYKIEKENDIRRNEFDINIKNDV